MTKALVIALFVLAAVAFAVLGWLARGEDSKIPRFGDLAAIVMQYEVGRIPVGRIAVLGFWWWVGWHFFAR